MGGVITGGVSGGLGGVGGISSPAVFFYVSGRLSVVVRDYAAFM